jgi:hypothetical protein
MIWDGPSAVKYDLSFISTQSSDVIDDGPCSFVQTFITLKLLGEKRVPIILKMGDKRITPTSTSKSRTS